MTADALIAAAPRESGGTVVRATATQIKLHARRNQFAPAQALLEQARSALSGQAPDPLAALELDIAEGVLMYFRGDVKASIDRLQRCRAAAAQCGARDAEADTAASLALHLLKLDRTSEVMVQAAAALRLAGPDDHFVVYRATLALAHVCQASGAAAHSQSMFRHAAAAARALGDALATAATVGRMSRAQALEMRRLATLGSLPAEALRQASVALRTALKWNAGTVASGHVAIDQLLLAALCRLRGDPVQAEVLIDLWAPQAGALAAPESEADVASERAQCRFARGDTLGAARWAREASRLLPRGGLSVHTPLVLHNIASVLKAVGDPGAAVAEDEAALAIDRYELRRRDRQMELETQWRRLGLAQWLQQREGRA